MPKIHSPLAALDNYLPENAFESVEPYIVHHKIHLTITRERVSILGNYKKSTNKNHAITVNGNLNKYSFLITLLHELGHLLAFEKFGNKIIAHGTEWKNEYGNILADFIGKNIFPRDIEKELIKTLNNPGATSCAETSLLRVLKKYDTPVPGVFLLEDLPEGSVFRVKNGKTYKKGKKLRKRFLCQEIATSRMYLFSPVAEVELLNK
ncbi:MAG: hypothetical protein ABI123_09935 [Ginsengibacter sp.]|jgi:hypothetical protein